MDDRRRGEFRRLASCVCLPTQPIPAFQHDLGGITFSAAPLKSTIISSHASEVLSAYRFLAVSLHVDRLK